MCDLSIFTALFAVTCVLYAGVCNDIRPSSVSPASGHDPRIFVHFHCLTGLASRIKVPDFQCWSMTLVSWGQAEPLGSNNILGNMQFST